jgi:ribonuclease P protein component
MASAAGRTLGARLITLKRRSDFLRVRRGARVATAAFVVEACARECPAFPPNPTPDRPRFGFTVTKKVGTAVERNRIRRRLKEAVRTAGKQNARGDFDYVVIARRPALAIPFARLCAELAAALKGASRRAEPASGRVRPKKNAR